MATVTERKSMSEETNYLFCPQCTTEQPCTKKGDKWKCDVCGSEFDEYESEDAENTQVEEEDIF